MLIPEPKPGDLITYSFLWSHEHDRGQEEGLKFRPCLVISSEKREDGKVVLVVYPITHTRPKNPDAAIELNQEIKKQLGFGVDLGCSWVCLHDNNEFLWVGPDVKLSPKQRKAPRFTCVNHHVPDGFLKMMQRKIKILFDEKQVMSVKRTHEDGCERAYRRGVPNKASVPQEASVGQRKISLNRLR